VTDICPICGEPHGKGVPNTPEVTRRPAPQPVASVPEEVLPPVAEPEPEPDVLADFIDEAPEIDEPEPEQEPEPEPEKSAVDRSHLSFKKLREEAAERNITVPFGATKAVLIDLLSGDDAP
jgi:hypothetical protein